MPKAAVTGAAVPPFKFDAKRWTTADRITGIASGVLFISLFLPWFGIALFGSNVTADGLDSHGFLYIVLFVVIAMVLYLAARSGWEKLPIAVPVAHSPVMLVASTLNLVLVVIAFIFKPGGAGVGWEFGSFVALIAAAIAVGPTALPALQARRSTP